jgi:hypothetical protein
MSKFEIILNETQKARLETMKANNKKLASNGVITLNTFKANAVFIRNLAK